MESNDALVDYLVGRGRIETERVEAAFRNVDRQRFVPDEHTDEAYQDQPLPIGDNATISAPHMVAVNTELLAVRPDSTVVEIGAGSGYQLAIFAELTDEDVIGVEISEELVERSREAVAPWDNARVVHGSGLDAIEEMFDRILYSCAVSSIDRAVGRLNNEGIIVAPVGARHGQVLKKYHEGQVTEHGQVRFVQFQEE